MNPALIPAVLGTLAGLGIAVMIAGLVRSPVREADGERPVGPLTRMFRAAGPVDEESRALRSALWAAAAVAGAGAWLFTKVPVIGLGIAGLVVMLPKLLLPNSAERRLAERQLALAEWTRSLAERIKAGNGLDQALVASTRDVPRAIEPAVGRLAARIHAGWSTADALLAFSDDLSDGTADFAAQALIASAHRRGAGLVDTLQKLARAVSQQVETQQAIETDRARVRSTVRTLVLIAIGVFVGLPLLEPDFMAPYRSASGQLVLAVLLTCAALSLLWAKWMARTVPEPRLFGADAARSPSTDRQEQR